MKGPKLIMARLETFLAASRVRLTMAARMNPRLAPVTRVPQHSQPSARPISPAS